jgi:hypothetical protein
LKELFFTVPSLAHGLTARLSLPYRISRRPITYSEQLAASGFIIMTTMRKHNVTTFPRPPIVERVNRHIQIKWHGQLLADCPPGEGYWVLEAHHAPGP